MIKIGLIGCGYWGKNYVNTLRDMQNVFLSYVCDVSEANSKQFQKKLPDTRFIADYQEILKDKDIAVVIIATPTRTHFQIAKEFIQNEKHVLVEKPLTTEIKTAEILCRLADEKKVQLMVGEIFRFNNALKYAKEIIDKGEIGELRYIEARRVGLGPIRNDVSALWDLATHDIYISNLVTEDIPSRVSYSGISHNGKLDDIVSLNLRYERKKILSTIYVNWEHPIKERKIFFGGTKKAILFDDIEPSDKIRIYDKGVDYQSKSGEFGDFIASTRDGDIVIPKIKLTQPLEEEVENFINFIQGKGACLSSGLMALETVRVLEAAEKSRLKNGAEIIVK